MECLVGCEEVRELRITWALIYLLWASLFHRPLLRPDRGTKWSVAACQVCNPRWAHG